MHYNKTRPLHSPLSQYSSPIFFWDFLNKLQLFQFITTIKRIIKLIWLVVSFDVWTKSVKILRMYNYYVTMYIQSGFTVLRFSASFIFKCLPTHLPQDQTLWCRYLAYNKLFKRLPWQRNLEKKDINHNHLPDVLIVELSDI